MSTQITDKINALLETYVDKLADRGMVCKVSKKYFEEDVKARMHFGPANPINFIDHLIDRKNEKKYNGERNRYHTVVLRFIPLKKGVLEVEDCKEYAFLIRKVERAHTGIAPEEKSYSEEKILKKIEKRILKIIAKADKSAPEKACRNNFFDGVRYFYSIKYNYKDTILGISRDTWDILEIVSTLAVAALAFFIAWLIVY